MTLSRSRSWRLWAGRLLLLFATPIVLLISTEVATRWLGWGYPTSFLIEDQIEGRAVWRSNPFFGYRFFPPLMARKPAPLIVERKKPAGLTRVVVLGESAAMGDPLIEYGLARALDKTLNIPGEPRKYEVINAAMTAISSPVIVEIAEEFAAKDTDIFVVYMGNNEIIGPYGPETVFHRDLGLPWLTRWHARWTRTRLASALGAATAPRSKTQAWEGLAMFSRNRMLPDDPRLPPLRERFEQNTEDIVRAAQRRGAKTILCTVAVNVRDCPPFASLHDNDLEASAMARWQSAYERGLAAQQSGDHAAAREAFAEAMTIDDGHAELLYRLAQTTAQMGEEERAAELYRRARDADAQRVRTDAKFNQRIRQVAERTGATLVDVEELFGVAPGEELFVDHVHFTVPGVALLAQAVAGAIEDLGYPVPSRPGPEEIGRRMMFDDWGRSKLAAMMMKRLQTSPFTDQAGNAQRLASWESMAREATDAMNKPSAESGAGLSDLQAAYPHDDVTSMQRVHRLAGRGAWPEGAKILDDIRPLLRGYSDTVDLAAFVYGMAGRPEDAAALLLSGGPPYGYHLVDSSFWLADSLGQFGRRDAARETIRVILQSAGSFPGRRNLEVWLAQISADRN